MEGEGMGGGGGVSISVKIWMFPGVEDWLETQVRLVENSAKTLHSSTNKKVIQKQFK